MQETGFRIQVTGAGAMLNCELWVVSCLLTSGHRRLPTAYCILFTAFCLLPSAFEGLAGRFARPTAKDKMSPHAWRRNRSKFKK